MLKVICWKTNLCHCRWECLDMHRLWHHKSLDLSPLHVIMSWKSNTHTGGSYKILVWFIYDFRVVISMHKTTYEGWELYFSSTPNNSLLESISGQKKLLYQIGSPLCIMAYFTIVRFRNKTKMWGSENIIGKGGKASNSSPFSFSCNVYYTFKIQ